MSDICVDCGRRTNPGSGLFVDRVPVFDDYETNVDCGRPYPKGEYICWECVELWEKENG